MVDWRIWRSRKNSSHSFRLPTIEDAADDGEAMAIQAALMSLKNRILINAITTDSPFDEHLYFQPTKDIVTELAQQSEDAAAVLDQTIIRARKRRGEALSRDDFRRGDVPNLITRRDTLLLVAKRLRKHSEDSQWLSEHINKAHSMAWEEISREMEMSLDRTEAMEFGDESYEAEREKRIREFTNINLAQLIEEHSPEY